MESQSLLPALRALADPTRLRIVQFLASSCCRQATLNDEGGVYAGPTAGEVCCHITGAERITSTVSHHLHELEAAGLISIERQGKRMICALMPDALQAISQQITQLATGTAAEDCPCAEACE